MANMITSNNMKPDSIWLDIEGGGSCEWATSSENRVFYQSMLAAAIRTWGSIVGVYSSAVMWQKLFGSTTWINSGDSSIKLWYAHYDLLDDFSDFRSFSSWTTPHVKQYAGDVTICNFRVDYNYAPSFFGLPMSTPPLWTVACSYNSMKGTCEHKSVCAERHGTSVPSSMGATGCASLPGDIMCCVGADTP
jgi:hypothetical protein